jgi:hypothetical protein
MINKMYRQVGEARTTQDDLPIQLEQTGVIVCPLRLKGGFTLPTHIPNIEHVQLTPLNEVSRRWLKNGYFVSVTPTLASNVATYARLATAQARLKDEIVFDASNKLYTYLRNISIAATAGASKGTVALGIAKGTMVQLKEFGTNGRYYLRVSMSTTNASVGTTTSALKAKFAYKVIGRANG